LTSATSDIAPDEQTPVAQMALFCVRPGQFLAAVRHRCSQPRPSRCPGDWAQDGLGLSRGIFRARRRHHLGPYPGLRGRDVLGAVQEWLAAQVAGDVPGFVDGGRCGFASRTRVSCWAWSSRPWARWYGMLSSRRPLTAEAKDGGYASSCGHRAVNPPVR
jgi:hypothetical protein